MRDIPSSEKPVDITEVYAKTALIRSKLPGVGYVINPYIGCGHGCRYCYAAFMRKYSRHHRQYKWGTFVEVKINIGEILRVELSRKRKAGTVMLSSVCDPYQPAERQYGLTRHCIELLEKFSWGIDILTRSPLVIRDIDLLSSAPNASVGISIPTDCDEVRRILEPNSPSIESRVKTLKQLRNANIPTWAFIGPMLPMNPRSLYDALHPYVDYVYIDSLNYSNMVRPLFIRNGWEYELTDDYAHKTGDQLIRLFTPERAERV